MKEPGIMRIEGFDEDMMGIDGMIGSKDGEMGERRDEMEGARTGVDVDVICNRKVGG